MNYAFIAQTQQSWTPPSLPGCWRLGAGRAVSFVPHQDAILRVAHGGMWITLGRGPEGAGNESGDVFLNPGEQMSVRSGQHLVAEALGTDGAPAYFMWDPVACPDNSGRWRALSLPSMSSAATRFSTWLRGVLPNGATPQRA